MSVIYLKHEKHGTKVAIDESEALYDIGNGWTRYTLESSKAITEPAPVAVEPDIRGANDDHGDGERKAIVEQRPADSGELSLEDLREAYKEKFGKKAHHKKSAEALKKELGL